MGKSNGRIQDWVKGGSGLRVTNGAAHVRIMGGGGGGSVTFPITPAQGGTGTTTVFTQGSVVFVGPAGVYAQDNANFNYNDTTNILSIGPGPVIIGQWSEDATYSAISLQGPFSATNYTLLSKASDVNLYVNAKVGGSMIFLIGGVDYGRINSGGRWLIGGAADDGVSKFQVNGQTNFNNAFIVNTFGRTLLGATDDGSSRLQVSGDLAVSGNYNGAPSVTGSRVANPALASLLTQLAASKIIVDNTTV